jgi:hypothetical protein
VEAKNKWGHTPLHWAAANDHKAVAALLLQSGAPINAKNRNNKTPLYIAIENHKYSIVKALLTFINQAEQRLRKMVGQGSQEEPSLLAKCMDNGKKDKDEEDKNKKWENLTPLLVEKIAEKVVGEARLVWLPLFSIKSNGKTALDLLRANRETLKLQGCEEQCKAIDEIIAMLNQYRREGHKLSSIPSYDLD